MLLHKAGQTIDEGNLEKVLSAAGVKPDKARAKAVTAAISEVNIDEAIATAAMPVAAAVAAPAETASAKVEPKKEEKEEETEEVQGLGALFG